MLSQREELELKKGELDYSKQQKNQIFEHLQTQNSHTFLLLACKIQNKWHLRWNCTCSVKYIFLCSYLSIMMKVIFFFCRFFLWEIIIFGIATTALFEFSTDAFCKYFELISCLNCRKSYLEKYFSGSTFIYYEQYVDEVLLFLLLELLQFLSEKYKLIFRAILFLINFVKIILQVISFEIQNYWRHVSNLSLTSAIIELQNYI